MSAVSASISSLTLSAGNVTGSTGTLALGGNVISTGSSAIASRVLLSATRSFDVTNTLTLTVRSAFVIPAFRALVGNLLDGDSLD